MLPSPSKSEAQFQADSSPSFFRAQARVSRLSGNSTSLRDGVGRTVGDYIRILRKYRWGIFGVALMTIAITSLYVFLATPQYTAVATLKVGTYLPILPGRGVEDELRQQTYAQEYFKTQIGQLSSLTIADQVLSQDNTAEELKSYFNSHIGLTQRATSLVSSIIKPLFSKPHQSPDIAPTDSSYRHPIRLLQSYLTLIAYSDVHNTTLVNVSATTADPVLSAKLANLHSLAFVELVRSELKQGSRGDLGFLQEQADELEQKIVIAEQDLSEYAEKNAIVPSENIVATKLGEVNQLLTEATAKRIKSESALTALSNAANSVDANTAPDDEATISARNALQEAKAEYAKLNERFKPTYPKLLALAARIDSLEKSLAEHRKDAVRTAELQLEQDKNDEKKLQEQLEAQKSLSFDLARRQVKYNTMQREFDSLKDLHQAVLRQLKEAQVRAASTRSNATISEAAPIPVERSKPKRLLDILLAAIFGPLLGFLLALFRENFDDTVQSIEDVRDVLGLPVLGIVPLFKPTNEPEQRLRQRIEDQSETSETDSQLPVTLSLIPAESRKRLVLLNSPHSTTAEAFRLIRTNLLLSSVDCPPRAILFTSAFKGEGKTTIVSNLAIAMAQASGKTVVVEADLRQPTFRTLFSSDVVDVKLQPGLSNYLAGHVSLQDVLYRMPVENLTFIPSGSAAPNPSELLGAPKFNNMVQELLRQFDYVLIDAPPVIAVADALVLSRAVDGTVLVVKSNHTQKRMVNDVALRLAQVNSRVLGVVLNQAKLEDRSYFPLYANYKDYYSEPVDGGAEQRVGNL